MMAFIFMRACIFMRFFMFTWTIYIYAIVFGFMHMHICRCTGMHQNEICDICLAEECEDDDLLLMCEGKFGYMRVSVLFVCVCIHTHIYACIWAHIRMTFVSLWRVKICICLQCTHVLFMYTHVCVTCRPGPTSICVNVYACTWMLSRIYLHADRVGTCDKSNIHYACVWCVLCHTPESLHPSVAYTPKCTTWICVRLRVRVCMSVYIYSIYIYI